LARRRTQLLQSMLVRRAVSLLSSFLACGVFHAFAANDKITVDNVNRAVTALALNKKIRNQVALWRDRILVEFGNPGLSQHILINEKVARAFAAASCQ
jgi:hypothetical protein